MIQTQATVVDIQHSSNKQVAFVYFKLDQSCIFQEGQFMFLERLWFTYPDGKLMKNAYSIGTTNSLLQDKGIIGTIVKKSSEGGMSDYLTQHIKIGERIKITLPLGHFIDKKISHNYVFISIGSGITPVYAIYNQLIETGNFNYIINIFGDRYKENILSIVQQNYKSDDYRIKHLLYLSQEKDLPLSRKKGYVQDGLDVVFETFNWQEFQIFLCGKPAMVDDVVAILLDKGVQKHYIHFEKY